MKIKWGALVVDGRGKIGGHVASKNLGGSYLRTKVTPTNPNTAFQSAVRALFGAISAQWAGLTSSARASWAGAVSEWQQTDVFGDLKKPTGKALFQRLNNQAQVVGLPAIALPPAHLEMPIGIVSAIAIDTTAETLTLTGADTDAATQVVVGATATLSDGTTSAGNKLRQTYYEAGDSFDSSAAYDAYVARFGVPTVGGNVFGSVKYVLASGQASPEQVLNIVIS